MKKDLHKKILILLIGLFLSLNNISNVSAMSNLNDFSDLVIDEGGTFYSINSNTSATAGGYNIMELTGTSNGLKYNVAFPTASFNYGTYGGHLVQCNLGLTEGSYYSITYFFQNESGYNAYLHPFYTSRTYKLGIYNNVNNYSTSFNAEAISDGVQNYPSMYGGYVGSFTLIFKAPITGTCLGTTFSTNSVSPANNASYFGFLGYKLENLGSKPLSSADIQNAMTQSLTSVENKLNNLNNQQQQTNDKLDDIYNEDISESDKELPNEDSFNDYTDAENELKDKINQADMNNISIGIDSNSSSFVWDTLTMLIQSHNEIFGLFIAILSIGIIKLALGR